jgi:predicted peptidase
LHGKGQEGEDDELLMLHGLPRLADENRDFPFAVLAPQMPVSMPWSTSEFLATIFPHRFAAVAPIAGGGDPDLAQLLKDTPVWAFQGSADRVTSPYYTQTMVEALAELGADVRFYPVSVYGTQCVGPGLCRPTAV